VTMVSLPPALATELMPIVPHLVLSARTTMRRPASISPVRLRLKDVRCREARPRSSVAAHEHAVDVHAIDHPTANGPTSASEGVRYAPLRMTVWSGRPSLYRTSQRTELVRR